MKRENWKRKILSTALACSLVLSIVSGVPAQATVKKVPTLSRGSKNVKVKKSFTLKLKKNQTKKIVKTTWKASNKKIILSKKKKLSVLVTGKTAGTSQITATVTYKNSGSQKKKKLTCKVTVKKALLRKRQHRRLRRRPQQSHRLRFRQRHHPQSRLRHHRSQKRDRNSRRPVSKMQENSAATRRQMAGQ